MTETLDLASRFFERLGDVTRVPSFGSLGENDRAFLQRMYSGDAGRYLAKIRSIGFTDRSRVLDLGCGFGQWSFVLASVNKDVLAVEVDEKRVRFVRELAAQGKFSNVAATVGTGDHLPAEARDIDAVFCFGVLQYLDTTRLMRELTRVLRPGGRAYFTGKDVGGYLYFWKERPHRTADYDPREIAADAFANTLFLQRFGTLFPGHKHRDRIISCEQFCDLAKQHRLHTISAGLEGSVCAEGMEPHRVNFFVTEYEGYPKSWEALLEKKA